MTPQTPFVQLGLPFGGRGQALPQAPQCSTSLSRSTHEASHFSKPRSHVVLHPELLQTKPVSQVLPHAPQLKGSVPRLTQAFWHAVKWLDSSHSTTHCEPLHAAAPFSTAWQATPQPPQFSGSIVTSAQNVPQSWEGAGQT